MEWLVLGETFIFAKEYKLDYILKVPPHFARSNKEVWKQAFTEYLRRKGIDINKITKVDNVEWNEVTRIFNTLIGKKNPKRKEPKDYSKVKLKVS